MFAIDAAIRYN